MPNSNKQKYSDTLTIRVFADSKQELQGKKIKLLRLSAGYSQIKLGNLLSVGRGTIALIEKKGAQDGAQLFEIAKIFNISVDELKV